MNKTILKIVPFLFFCNVVFAQSGIKVHVTDSLTSQPLSFANVAVEMNDELVEGTWTDINGNAVLKPLDTGVYYLVVVFQGYDYGVKQQIKVIQDSILFVTIQMEKTNELTAYTIGKFIPEKSPIKCYDTTVPGVLCVSYVESNWATGKFSREDISRFPSNDIAYVKDFFPHR